MEWDLGILEALQRDGRLSARELAIATGMSRSAAWRRKANLEESGVILGYRAVVAPAFLSAQQDMVLSVMFDAMPTSEACKFERQASGINGVIGLLRVGLSTYWGRVATRESLLNLEELVCAQNASVLKFDVAPVLSEIVAYRDPPIRRP